VLQPDLGPEAVQRSLEASLDDGSIPLDERIGHLLILAGSDQAMHQHEAALTKYEIIRDHHIATGNAALAAVALNGMGESLEKLGQLGPAGAHYEHAVVLAGQGDHPPVPILLNAMMNLGRVRQTESRWAEAAAWWDLAQQIAVVARNAPARLQAMEYLGICQFRLGAREEAEHTLTDASVIAAALEDLPACRSIVLRLCQYYQSIGAHEKEQERREQLAALEGA
jgi:tetratricopeptide (TPR) repeat protein